MRAGLLAVAVACALVLFTAPGRIGAIDRREARDLLVAGELIGRASPGTTATDAGGAPGTAQTLGREDWAEKPLLAYAPDVVVRLASRHPEVPSRLWRAVAALLLVVLTGSVGAQHFGARAGLCAALVLATSLALPVAARADGTQVLAALLGWLGAAGFADAWFGRASGRWSRILVTWAALALALIVAGPLPALWPFAGVALFLVLARRRFEPARMGLIPGLAIVAVLALPWYVLMTQRHGVAFLGQAAFYPYATSPPGPWHAGPLAAVSYLVIGFFPWVTVLPGAMLHAAERWRVPPPAPPGTGPSLAPLARDLSEGTASHYFLACAIAALLPIALYRTPPLTAVLPALPAFALLCGRFLDHVLEDPKRVAAVMTRGFVMLALTGTVAGVMFLLLGIRIPEAGANARTLGTLLFVTSWVPLLVHLTHRPRAAVLLVALPIVVCAPLAHLRLLPGVEGWLNTRPVAMEANRVVPEGSPLFVLGDPPPSLRLYSERTLVPADTAPDLIAATQAADAGGIIAFRPGRRSLVEAAGTIEILLQTPTLILARVPAASTMRP